MIIVMEKLAKDREVSNTVQFVESMGYQVHLSPGVQRTILGIIGDERHIRAHTIEQMPGVEKIIPILKPYKLANREFHPGNSTIRVENVVIGGDEIIVMAGPCSVESPNQVIEAAIASKEAGAESSGEALLNRALHHTAFRDSRKRDYECSGKPKRNRASDYNRSDGD